MSKRKQPQWILNENWAVSTDPYNWILYSRSGKNWRATGYYPTPQMLLKSLHREITRKEPRQATLELHLLCCLETAQAVADRFLGCLATYPQVILNAPPPQLRRTLEMEVEK
jgi:hypothetical protein